MRLAFLLLAAIAVACVSAQTSLEDKLRAATDRLEQQLVTKVIYKEESIHDEKKLVRDLEALTSTRLELNRNLTVSKNEAPGCRKVTQDKDKGGHLKCVPDYPPVSCWGWPVSSLLDPQSFLTYSYTSAEMVVSFGIIVFTLGIVFGIGLRYLVGI